LRLPVKPATSSDFGRIKKEVSATSIRGRWGKNKTSSIRGGTRSGGQSSWSENHIQWLTLHQLIFFDIFIKSVDSTTQPSNLHTRQNDWILVGDRTFVLLSFRLR